MPHDSTTTNDQASVALQATTVSAMAWILSEASPRGDDDQRGSLDSALQRHDDEAVFAIAAAQSVSVVVSRGYPKGW
jgi:hypothetical protein